MSCKKCKTNKCECEVTTCINPLIYMIKDAFSLVETSTNNLAAMTILSEIYLQAYLSQITKIIVVLIAKMEFTF